MCGIFGYFSHKNPLSTDIMVNALQNLQHRGPDQEGYWQSKDKRVGLGQTRLSINDLSQVDLPFKNSSHQIFVVANAEIYNHRSLRKGLEQKGYHFRTGCDLEVIPYLYEEYGINFLNKLRGEFAFAIWDAKQKVLYLVRDRFGIKPLYYTIHDGSIYFCSELPALFKSGIGRNKWNLETIYEYAHLNLPYDKTLFENIHQVPPGQYMAISSERCNLFSYWDLNYSSDANFSLDHSIEEIHDKLVDAVTVRLEADVPVGCYLSGGLDSSTLLGMASRISSKNINAFTLAFDDKQVDESSIAAEMAKHAGATFHPLLVTENDIVNHFELVVKHTCHPIPNAAGIARFLLSQFTREKGFKAVLSGEGADEVFLGYFGAIIEAAEDPFLKADFMLSEEDKQKLFQQQLPVNRSPGFIMPFWRQCETILQHIPSWLKTQTFFNAKYRELLSDNIKKAFSDYNPYLSLINALNVQHRMLGYDRVQISSYTWIKSFFPNTMLSWVGDRSEMANSIEARHPFLDHELFELLAKIPTPFKIKGGIEKYLLREVAKPYVTPEIYQRKKFMFQAPPLRLNPNSKFYQFICDIIYGNIERCDLYDRQKVLNLLDLSRKAGDFVISEKAEISYTLTTLASMLILHSSYGLA